MCWPSQVATIAPTMPSRVVTMNPCGPGTNHLAIAPARNPMMMTHSQCMSLFGVCTSDLVVVQHHASPHLPSALQVAQRRAGLVGRPRLERDRWDLAGLDEREKLAEIVEGADIGAFDGYHLE